MKILIPLFIVAIAFSFVNKPKNEVGYQDGVVKRFLAVHHTLHPESSVSVVITNLKDTPSTTGRCYINPNSKTVHITLNKNQWESLSSLGKYAVLDHEVSYCTEKNVSLSDFMSYPARNKRG